ncbi:MAG TPA: hypothetical protein VD704_07655, partial [Gaiellaceae bacterium]|nr:hypothetical protein [Gaiellaceae bacterium]
MPRAPWTSDAVYAAGQRFLAECLRQDGSLFTPGRPVWTPEGAGDIVGRVGPPEQGKATFWQKLERQLDGAAPDVIQLAAEAVFVQYLGEDDTYGHTKRDS